MRPQTLLSLFLLVAICASGSACEPQTAPPDNRAPAGGGAPVATQTPTPTQTPLPTASPAATASPLASPVATASPSPSPTHMTYSVYKDTRGEWRWRLVAANNRIVADSGEGYRNRQDCLSAIELIKNSKGAPVVEKP